MKHWIQSIVCVVAISVSSQVFGQQGDKKDKQGEKQEMLVPRELIPPAPHLSPEEALQSFQLPPGFRIEIVAHEPMVETPVAMVFDPAGRLWVVEMRGYMPNADGTGELDVPGRVVTLEDTDGDGRMDKRTVFLDNLIMPRTIALAGDGVLVGEPPNLWMARDTDGDGRCDQKTAVATDYGSLQSIEHTANGMVWALDNWYYNLYHTYRYRPNGTKWDRHPVPNRVQWGLAQDNFGRRYFTSNSDQLRGDLFPSHYVGSKPGIKLNGLNVKVASDQSTWPARVNPGVNRGYRKGTLRDDFTLARFTAACGTTIYRGHLFPEEFQGNAFVCEPSANFIRRNILTQEHGMVSAKNAYDKAEFLTSTDERFRPVNLYTGPDGALYILDMYHGILQHRVYLTTYLRRQVEERGLDAPLNQGRIYRVVPEHKTGSVPATPNLEKADSGQLVSSLAHPNGWVRDTAQRLLVQGAQIEAAPLLRKMAMTHSKPLARLHALWALEGLDQVDEDTLLAALQDEHPENRRAGLRISESFLRILTDSPDVERIRSGVLALSADPAIEVRMQLALSLGAIAYGPAIQEVLTSLSRDQDDASVKNMADFSLSLRNPKPEKDTPKVAAGRPLTEAEQKQFVLGKEIFSITCIACHQAHGMGQEGLAPPLVGSKWVGYSPQRLARIVLHGLRGPIEILGETYELDMPALGVLNDTQIAASLTYIRREWGHGFDPIKTEDVTQAREATMDREDAWTVEELLKIP